LCCQLCREYGGRFTQGRLDGNFVLLELEGDGGRDPRRRAGSYMESLKPLTIF
jgi:hypothetical protein